MFYECFPHQVSFAAFGPHSQNFMAFSSMSLLFNNLNWFLQSVHGSLTPSISLEWYRAWDYLCVTQWSLVLEQVLPLYFCFVGTETAVFVWTRGCLTCQKSLLRRGSWLLYVSMQLVSLFLPSHVSSCADKWDATFKQNMGAQFVRIAKNTSGNTF